jgi:PAS domain S-box-containing protein
VASLLARGLTNRQIAAELVLTAGTVANHVRAILLRAGFSSRAQIAAWLGVPGTVRVDDAPGITAVFDDDGAFVKANTAMARLLGYEEKALEGRCLADLAADGAGSANDVLKGLRDDGVWRGELRLRRRDRSTVTVEAVAQALDTPAGRLYVASFHDLSERHEIERQQREFVMMLGHELRSPLTAIRGYAQLMQQRGAASPDALEVILHQTRRLERLANDLVDLTRQDIGQFRLERAPTDLVRLARSVAAHASAMSPIHDVRVEAPNEPVVGAWDRGRLEQVLDNLLSNAVKYSPDGGPIVVGIDRRGSQVELSVTDRGVGIPPWAVARLFDRFYRVERPGQPVVEGLGLGLAVARALVEAHGGTIAVASAPGHGSTFTVVLPYCRPT